MFLKRTYFTFSLLTEIRLLVQSWVIFNIQTRLFSNAWFCVHIASQLSFIDDGSSWVKLAIKWISMKSLTQFLTNGTILCPLKIPLSSGVYHGNIGLKWIKYTASKVSIFGVLLVRIFPHSDWIGEIRSISPYSVQMREDTDQKTPNRGTSRSHGSLQLLSSYHLNFCVSKIHLLRVVSDIATRL